LDETEISFGESYASAFASCHVSDKSLLFNDSGSLNLNYQPQEDGGQHENYSIAKQNNTRSTIDQQAVVCLSPSTSQGTAEDCLHGQGEPHYFLSTEPGRDVIWIQSDDSKSTHIELNICQTASKIKQIETTATSTRKPAKAHRRRGRNLRELFSMVTHAAELTTWSTAMRLSRGLVDPRSPAANELLLFLPNHHHHYLVAHRAAVSRVVVSRVVVVEVLSGEQRQTLQFI